MFLGLVGTESNLSSMEMHNPLGQTSQTSTSFEFSTGLRSQLNLLILLHILFFVALDDRIYSSLAVSSRSQDWPFNWTTSLFTYQFVYLNVGELLLSVSMLWLFGHILKKRVGQWKVIIFYFALAFISALVFNLSHLVFPIFSGPGGFMEGAFGGVLGVMTAGVMLYGRHRFQMGKYISFRLWQVYSFALLLSFMMVYKNNVAYVLVYACNIYLGIKYAKLLEMREAGIRSFSGQSRPPYTNIESFSD